MVASEMICAVVTELFCLNLVLVNTAALEEILRNGLFGCAVR